MRTYQINFDGTNWNVKERKFPTDAAAIAYVRKLENADGRIERTSHDRLEIRFDEQ